MTTDQATPVAASQPATDTSSQEVSKPKRTPTTRKPKTAAKPAAGKNAAKTAESAPAQESKATQAPASAPKTSASKTTSAAKASSRSAGKTTKTAATKSKKTAADSKEISTATPGAAATADTAPTATPAAKSTAKATTGRSTTRGTRKPKSAAAQGDEAAAQTASAVSPAAAEDTQNVAAPKTAKTPRGRSGAAKGRPAATKTGPKAAATEAKPAAAPVETQSAPQPAPKAGALAESSAATAPAVAPAIAPASAMAAPEKISDKSAERAPRHNAAPAARQAEAQEADQASEATDTAAEGDSPAGDSPRRKNRRGRRGGRGRNRKKEQNAQAGQDADSQASSEDLDDDLADDLVDDLQDERAAKRADNRTDKRAGARDALADDLPSDLPSDLDDDLDDDADSIQLDDELSDTARESRPRQAPRQTPRQGKPQQQGKQANRQVESGKTQEGKTSDTAKGKGEKPTAEAPKGKRRMFISVLPGEQVEVALAEEGQLLEYYLDMLHQRKIKGNIYKGVIHNIDTNLQAAFVSYGAGKNGFLQIDEVHPEYWLAHHEPTKGKKFPPIQKVLKAGQEVLVQVVKEPTGSKGAFLTTWLSLAGRFLVLTPGQDQIGVSRKVDDDDERARLREMMNGIDPGQGLGVIVRTVSAGTTKTTLKNDLQYLKRVWRDIRKKATEVSAPSLIYQEPGLSERAVRDYLTEDVCEIWVDSEEVAQSVRETVNLLFPRRRDLVRLHTDMRTPMWERFNLRRQLEQIYSREVLLPSGGRLVFDQTEALMAIDINSGKISGKGNFEAMAHKTNMEAADAIARHLKLRDIGGQVVIDFIEMRDKKHVLEVEKTLRTAMKNDRARHDVARMSSFGLLELVRQRTGSSALAISLEPCPACGGTGMRRNIEWQALQSLRELRRLMSIEPKEKCVYPASPELALYLLNHKRDTLREIEQDYGKCLEIMVRP